MTGQTLGSSLVNLDGRYVPGVYQVKNYGAKGDGVITTAAMTAGSPALTKTSGSFAATDVGKTVVVQGGGVTRTNTSADAAITTSTPTLTSATAAFVSSDVRSTISIPGAGPSGATLVTTIKAVINSTTVTLAANASTTVTAKTITVSAYLKSTIAAVTAGVATLANNAGATVSGASVLYGTDDTAAINAAISACSAAGAGTVFLPASKYVITAALTLTNNTAVRGAGNGITSIYMAGSAQFAAFYGTFTSASPLTDFTMSDLTIDALYHQAAFNVGNKGVFFQYGSRVTFRDMTIQNTLASGLGIDYLKDGSLIENVRANGCGAGSYQGTQGGGSSGIGIATGAYPIEEFAVIGCHAKGNGIYGIFIEYNPQGSITAPVPGARVIGCSANGNGISGFCDAGAAGAIWNACISYQNAYDGFTTAPGTTFVSLPGNDTLWSNCIAWNNIRAGFSYTAQFLGGTAGGSYPNTVARVSWKNCKSYLNGTGWIVWSWNALTFEGFQLDGCEAYNNGNSGLLFSTAVSGTGTLKNVRVNNCAFYNNGLYNGTDPYGIRVDCNISYLDIRGTRCYDSQATQTQTYGFGQESGIIDHLVFENNSLSPNKNGAWRILGTLANYLRVRNNTGVNPLGVNGFSVPGTAFALAASGTVWFNNTGVDLTLYCTAAGTVTAVSVNGTAVSATMAIGSSYRVLAGGSLTITYSSAPTLVAVSD